MASRFAIQDVRFILQIWDTAGQERFKSVSTAFFRGALCCIACFDLGAKETLAQTNQWIQQVRNENPSQQFAVFLVGCKSDLFHSITFAEGEAIAKEIGAEYFEISSKTGQRVNELFERVAVVLFDRVIRQNGPSQKISIGSKVSSNSVSIGGDSSSQSQLTKKCC